MSRLPRLRWESRRGKFLLLLEESPQSVSCTASFSRSSSRLRKSRRCFLCAGLVLGQVFLRGESYASLDGESYGEVLVCFRESYEKSSVLDAASLVLGNVFSSDS